MHNVHLNTLRARVECSLLFWTSDSCNFQIHLLDYAMLDAKLVRTYMALLIYFCPLIM